MLLMKSDVAGAEKLDGKHQDGVRSYLIPAKWDVDIHAHVCLALGAECVKVHPTAVAGIKNWRWLSLKMEFSTRSKMANTSAFFVLIKSESEIFSLTMSCSDIDLIHE